MLALYGPNRSEYAVDVKLRPGFRLYEQPSLDAPVAVVDSDNSGQTLRGIAKAAGGWHLLEYPIPASGAAWEKYGWSTSKGFYAPAEAVLGVTDNPDVPLRVITADCTAQITAATEPLSKKIATAKAALG